MWRLEILVLVNLVVQNWTEKLLLMMLLEEVYKQEKEGYFNIGKADVSLKIHIQVHTVYSPN